MYTQHKHCMHISISSCQPSRHKTYNSAGTGGKWVQQISISNNQSCFWRGWSWENNGSAYVPNNPRISQGCKGQECLEPQLKSNWTYDHIRFLSETPPYHTTVEEIPSFAGEIHTLGMPLANQPTTSPPTESMPDDPWAFRCHTPEAGVLSTPS